MSTHNALIIAFLHARVFNVFLPVPTGIWNFATNNEKKEKKQSTLEMEKLRLDFELETYGSVFATH